MQRYIKTKTEPSTSVFGGNSSRDADYEAVETITGDPVNNVQFEEIYAEEILQTEEEEVEEIVAGVLTPKTQLQEIEDVSSQIPKTKVHYCPHCGNSYTAAGGLTLHIRSCLKQKDAEIKNLESRKCKICGKIYNSVTYLKDHMLRHAGKGAQKCSRCNRRFLDEDKLLKHEKMHETLALFATETEDGETFNIPEKKVMKEFTCSFCHIKFIVIFDSKESVKRRFACDECLERFKDADELKKHKESREEKKEHRCDRCGRQFVFEGFLQRHTPTCDGILRKRRH